MKPFHPSAYQRVLFLGTTDSTSTSVYYYTSFLRLGYSVYAYNPDPHRKDHLVDRASWKLRKQPLEHHLKRGHDEIVRLCKTYQFDIVFAMTQHFIGEETLSEMRRVSKTPLTIIFHSHDNLFADGILKAPDLFETLPEYDYAFTTKSQNIDRYLALGQANSFFLPSAYEPTVHRPIASADSRYSPGQFDASFIGNYDQSRIPILQTVGWDHVWVWGERWNEYPEYRASGRHIHLHPLYLDAYADVVSHTKCSLGILREEANDRHTQRTFEIPACGGLQFSPRNEEILSFFKEDREIVCFDSLDELKDKITFFLKNDSKRESLARKGYERCLSSQHSYLDRVTAILQICGFSASKRFRSTGTK